MQRMPTGPYRQLDDEWVIDVPAFQSSSSSSPRRRVDVNAALADSSEHRPVKIIGCRRDVRRPWTKENWVHAILLVMLLSLFILWWFSYPVDISIKQGGVLEALHMVFQPSNTHDQKVELTILLLPALTPTSTTSPVVLSMANQILQEPPADELAARDAVF